MKTPRIIIPLVCLLLYIATMAIGCGPADEKTRVKAVIGQPSPDFILTDLKGKDWQLSAHKEKVVFINFWATWCPPCIKELPSMDTLNKSMPSTSFQMFTILYNDRPEMAQSMVNKSGYSFPVLIDHDSSVAKEYGLTGVPETFIIDTNGILKEKFIGPYDWNSPGAIAILDKYLPK